MAARLGSDEDVFRKMIDIGLRTYGDGHAYPTAIVEIVHRHCREQLSSCLMKHQQLLLQNNHLSFFMTIVYLSRHRRARLKRFEHYLQAKERSEQAAGDGEQQPAVHRMARNPKVTLNERFRRICRQLHLDLHSNERQVTMQIISLPLNEHLFSLESHFLHAEIRSTTIPSICSVG